ncbi:MAG: hypothetical protein HYZ38_23310 [Mycobacterium sp.]|nr:hypothetical protein [Mycobacterium sp.]
MPTARSVLTAALAVCPMILCPTAAADPVPLPDPPPYVPNDLSPFPGSYSYPYNVIMVGPPWTVDARGVQIGTNIDPGLRPEGLPGSQLGNSAHPDNSLTLSNARYGISAGIAPVPEVDPGVIIDAGSPAAGLENPDGRPPTSVLEPESVPPTAAPEPRVPPLEDSHGGRS